MSILINGVEMPTAGMCKTITIFDNGAVVEGNGSEKLGIAVPVPPHGRLIDADALLSQYNDNIWTAWTDYAKGLQDVVKNIEDAPTIIPAEEGE